MLTEGELVGELGEALEHEGLHTLAFALLVAHSCIFF